MNTEYIVNTKNDEITQYFEKLGYEVTWDFNRRAGEEWYEIIHPTEGLVCQIDTGIKLEWILEDMCEFHKGATRGIDRPDKPDYKISGEDCDELRELFQKVYENCHNGA